jgi:alkanesulfonate monooxygenase SsuD/methylene tetrahydromethanopterin reductase-like flavin-dependent oxidoreductase (luciferase family)
MEIGIGLPSTIPDTPGRMLVDWARRAEERGFSSVATIDRIVYPSYESMIALAGAAGVTERIKLLTNILIAPTRNPVLFAKEAAGLDQLSRGRLTLGLAAGGRADDFEVTEGDFHERGRKFDEQLETMHRAWRGEPLGGNDLAIGPSPANGTNVPVLIGGSNFDVVIPRVLKYGIGWTVGGAPAEHVAPMAQAIRDAWSAADKPGAPKIVALAYFALGGREDAGRDYLRHYYAFLGDYREQLASALIPDPDAVLEATKSFTDAGVDEFIFDPTVAEVGQVDLLADVVFS